VYVLVSDSLMQVSFAGLLSLPALHVVVCKKLFVSAAVPCLLIGCVTGL
jgi:hypothetical protein